jgi:hypothetical protein
MRTNAPAVREPLPAFPDAPPDIVLSLAQTKIDRQLGDGDAIDTKLIAAMGASGALVGISTAVVALRPHAAGATATGLLIASVALFFAIAVVGVLGLRVRGWQHGCSAVDLWKMYNARTEHSATWRVVRMAVRASEHNVDLIDEKSAKLNAALIGLALQLVLTVVAMLLVATD